MLTPGLAERERDLGDDARAVRHLRRAARARSRRSCRRRAARRGRRGRRSIQAPTRAGVARRAASRAPAPSRPSSSSIARQQRVGVGQVDVGPDRAVGARDADRVAEARPDRRAAARRPRRARSSVPAAWAASRLASTCGRCEMHAIRRSCVGGVDRGRARAEAPQQRVQALVEHAGGALARRGQVPGRAVEQVLAGVLDALGLGARERVAADEALVRRGLGEQPLGRADVADDAVAARRRRAPRRRRRGSAPTGRRDEHGLGARDRLGDARRRRGRSRRARAHARARPGRGRSRTPRPRRGRGRRGRSSRRSARRRGRRSASAQRGAVCAPAALRSRTDAASPSSTSTVVSQAMHPSVIDWP